MRESARALADLVAGRDPGVAVFLNRLGRPITRSGIRQLVERCAAKATARAPSADLQEGPVRMCCATAATGAASDIASAGWANASLDTTSVYAKSLIE